MEFSWLAFTGHSLPLKLDWSQVHSNLTAGINKASGMDIEEIAVSSVYHASITVCDTEDESNQSLSSVKYS